MDTDLLRWILAAGGVSLVGGIYLRDRFKRRSSGDRERFLRDNDYLPDEEWHELNDTAEYYDDQELPSMRVDNSNPVPDAAVRQRGARPNPPASDYSDQDEEAAPFEIVQIKVTALPGTVFAGDRLIEALHDIEMEFGSMDIFHKYGHSGDAPWFSVVNMVEPGTFPVDDADNFDSPGVVFFLQVALVDQPLHAFDDMISSVYRLAASLGGEIRDEDNELLSIEKTESIRISLVSLAGWSA